MSIEKRGAIVLETMAEVVGHPIPKESRKPEYFWPRAIVARVLYDEGFCKSEIARLLHKAPCTIIHALNRMDTAMAYPNVYCDVIRDYKELRTRI